MKHPRRDIFERQRKRRFGSENPERMDIEHWDWAVRTAFSAYENRIQAGVEHEYGFDPDWCFQRFGITRTRMPDGRIICIGGEHEDGYDPDFCIYNDVIVLRPGPGEKAVTPGSGEVTIYGYPEAVFPPTDFHSATLVGNQIVIIGRLGYMRTRGGPTPVYLLDTETYRIAPVSTSGASPGWVYGHHDSYDAGLHAITVRGGKRWDGSGMEGTISRHTAVHRLHLDGMRWEVLALNERHRWFQLAIPESHAAPDVEPAAEDFRPRSVPHEFLGLEDRGVETYLLSVDGVRITLQDFFCNVEIEVEGELPAGVLDTVLAEIEENLSRRTRRRWDLREQPESPRRY